MKKMFCSALLLILGISQHSVANFDAIKLVQEEHSEWLKFMKIRIAQAMSFSIERIQEEFSYDDDGTQNQKLLDALGILLKDKNCDFKRNMKPLMNLFNTYMENSEKELIEFIKEAGKTFRKTNEEICFIVEEIFKPYFKSYIATARFLEQIYQ